MTTQIEDPVYCPFCNAVVIAHGDDDVCENKHVYPSKYSMLEPCGNQSTQKVLTIRIPKGFHALIKDLAFASKSSINIFCIDALIGWTRGVQETLENNQRPVPELRSPLQPYQSRNTIKMKPEEPARKEFQI